MAVQSPRRKGRSGRACEAHAPVVNHDWRPRLRILERADSKTCSLFTTTFFPTDGALLVARSGATTVPPLLHGFYTASAIATLTAPRPSEDACTWM